MTDKQEMIIDSVDVGKYTLKEIEYKLLHTTKNKIIKSCLEIVKQLQRKTAECQRMKYFLNKIRNFELESLDVDWDRYEQEKGCTDFSPIITYVEQGLGEIEEDD